MANPMMNKAAPAAPAAQAQAQAPASNPAQDVQRAGRNKQGMLVLLKATMQHIFGIDAEQSDKIIKYMRSIGITTMDMQEEFVATNQNALFMLKSALKKELDQEGKHPEDAGGEQEVGGKPVPAQAKKLAPSGQPAQRMESKKKKPVGRTLLEYFRDKEAQ